MQRPGAARSTKTSRTAAVLTRQSSPSRTCALNEIRESGSSRSHRHNRILATCRGVAHAAERDHRFSPRCSTSAISAIDESRPNTQGLMSGRHCCADSRYLELSRSKPEGWTDWAISTAFALQNALTLVRERAIGTDRARHQLTERSEVRAESGSSKDNANLFNAGKFPAEGGGERGGEVERVEPRYRSTIPGRHRRGSGRPVFEEFRQVGRDYTARRGHGWGVR